MDDLKSPTQPAPRRAYVKPRVEETAVFEHFVLMCTANSPVYAQCDPKQTIGAMLQS